MSGWKLAIHRSRRCGEQFKPGNREEFKRVHGVPKSALRGIADPESVPAYLPKADGDSRLRAVN
jgi:hypothetical protein